MTVISVIVVIHVPAGTNETVPHLYSPFQLTNPIFHLALLPIFVTLSSLMP